MSAVSAAAARCRTAARWHLSGLPVLKNLNFSQICFVILTLALVTFDFSLVSGSFLLVLQQKGHCALERTQVFTPNPNPLHADINIGSREVAL